VKKNKTGWVAAVGLSVVVAGLLLVLFKPEILTKTTIATDPTTPGDIQIDLPSAAENESLVVETTLSFGRAIEAGDLSLFRDTTAEEFKQAFSEEQFNQAFGGFIEQNINLLAVGNYRPVFTASPELAGDGTLILQGHFPTKPSRVTFDYQYVWRSGDWQLSGIDVNVNPADDS
jgi:hypothetical protein